MKSRIGMVYYWDATDRRGWRRDFRQLKAMGIDYLVACDILSLTRTFREDRDYVRAALDEAQAAGLKVVLRVYSSLLMNSEHLPYHFLNPLYLSGSLLSYRYSFPKYRRNIEYSRAEERFLFVDCFDYVYPMFDVLNREWQASFLKPYLTALIGAYASHPVVAGIRFADLLYAPETAPYSRAHRRQFRQFLRQKYGDIRKLNVAWKSKFRSFAEIQPVRIPYVWAPEWDDWCAYRTAEAVHLARFIRACAAETQPALPVSFSETDLSVDLSWHAFGGLTPDFTRCFSAFCLVPERSTGPAVPRLLEMERALCGGETQAGLSVRVTKKAYLPAPAPGEVETIVRAERAAGAAFVEYDYFRMPPFPGNTYPRNTGLFSNPGLCRGITALNRSPAQRGRGDA
jgi:hypothetical protein